MDLSNIKTYIRNRIKPRYRPYNDAEITQELILVVLFLILVLDIVKLFL